MYFLTPRCPVLEYRVCLLNSTFKIGFIYSKCNRIEMSSSPNRTTTANSVAHSSASEVVPIRSTARQMLAPGRNAIGGVGPRVGQAGATGMIRFRRGAGRHMRRRDAGHGVRGTGGRRTMRGGDVTPLLNRCACRRRTVTPLTALTAQSTDADFSPPPQLTSPFCRRSSPARFAILPAAFVRVD